MFFCETCRVEREWPESMSQSRGKCEVCGNVAVCHDVWSGHLPVPAPPPPDISALEKAVRDAEWAVKQAQFALYEAKSALIKCHWCDKTNEDNESDGYGPLIDFRLIVSDGEEGYSNVLRYACQGCFETIQPKLVEIGFGVHAHGGICFMEDGRCPERHGGVCPSPEEQFPE